jgi:hypothetical protein
VPSENEPKTVLLLVEIPHPRSPDCDIRIGGDDTAIPDGAIRATHHSDYQTAMHHLPEKDWGVTIDSRALLHHLMILNQITMHLRIECHAPYLAAASGLNLHRRSSGD